MEFFDVLKSRYSVRAFEKREVESQKLSAVLEAARLAPTACNRQPFAVHVLKTADVARESLKAVYPKDWFADAPVVLAVCSQPDAAWVRSDGKSYADVDAAIVMDHIILAATALGLGTCWIGAFNPAAAKELFHLLPGFEPVALTPLGYAAGEKAQRPRRPLAELVKGL